MRRQDTTRRVEERPVSRPALFVPSMRDCDRILGQVERGEVLAGPEGARRIAARHEAAYGQVWAHQTAWNDAIAALTAGGDE